MTSKRVEPESKRLPSTPSRRKAEQAASRRRAEAALRESELLYHSLVEQLPQAIFRLDRAGRITFANSRYCEQVGRELKDLVGRTDSDLFPADLAAQSWADSRRVMDTGKAFETDERHCRPDGREFYVHVMKSPLRGSAGQIVGLQGSYSEVTDRKRAEVALRESEERYRAIFESIQDVYAEVALDGTIVEVSPSIAEFSGYQREEVLGRSLADFYACPEQRAPLLARLQTDGRVNDYEVILRNKAGQEIVTSFSVRVVTDASGKPVKTVGTMRDITRRKRAEADLHEANEFSTQIIASAREGIIVHDRAGNHVVWNRFMEELSGRPAAEVLGSRTLEVLPFLRDYDFDGMFQRALAGEIVVSPDIYYDGGRRGSRAWVAARLGPLRDGSGSITGVIAMVNDISERKELERQLLAISEREQQRIGQELHDGLSQQLTGVGFLNDSLRQKLAAKALPEAAEARRVAELLAQTQIELRQVARGLQPVASAPEGLRIALTELAKRVSEQCGIACRFLCPQRVRVRDNQTATHLFRIAQEAVNNALRHGHPKQISVALTTQSGTLVLEVEDNGRGLRPARAKGAGVGLRIMRSRSEAMSGEIEIVPARPSGTRVRCTVPLRAPAKRESP